MRFPDVTGQLIGRRAAAVLVAAAAGAQVQRAALASPGDGANVAPPAFLPSPIVPTGEMGKTCAVVALGRDDVCLEYKKVLTAYDQQQLSKVTDSLSDVTSTDATTQGLIDGIRKLMPLVSDNNFGEIDKAVPGVVAAASSLDKKLKDDAAALQNRCKEREASPIARATIKLAQDLMKLTAS